MGMFGSGNGASPFDPFQTYGGAPQFPSNGGFDAMSGVNSALSDNAATPRHHGGKFASIMGILGDALAGINGGGPRWGMAQMEMRQRHEEQNKPYRFQNNNGDVVEIDPRTGQQRVLYQDTPKQEVPSVVREAQWYRDHDQGDAADDIEAKNRLVPIQRAGPNGEVTTVYVRPTTLFDGGSQDNIPTVHSQEDVAKLPPGSRFRAPNGAIKIVPGGMGGAAPSNGPSGFPF